jgi:hypothetical protein
MKFKVAKAEELERSKTLAFLSNHKDLNTSMTREFAAFRSKR